MRKMTKRSQSNEKQQQRQVDDDDEGEEEKVEERNEGSFSATWRMKRKYQLNNNHLAANAIE